MTSSDPLDDLAPFLEARGRAGESEAPPEYLTARLIASRFSGFEPLVSPVPEDELPRAFGPYELRRVLGHGATGTVYAAHDAELDREVAVKILSPTLANLPDARERFLREARAAASLQHDHLMPVFAVHQDTPFPCLTMPLLEGETIESRLRREGPFPTDELVLIARHVATALQHAHSNNILHRDLKPSNIFLETTTGRAIVMDFGLARIIDAPSELTHSGAIAGSPEFLAPEQIDDNPDLTPATDLYSLGATLYTLASGKPPFSGISLTGLLKKVATQKPAPLPNLPAWLNGLILSLLSKSPESRPASAAKVLASLKKQSAPRKRSHLRAILLGFAAFNAVLAFFAFNDFKIVQDKAMPETTSPFSLTAALASDQTEIIIPEPGIYDLSLLIFERDLKISAAKPGTILRFTAPNGGMKTRHDLMFENLTIRYEVPENLPSSQLINTSGQRLTFKNCRLEQAGRETTNLSQTPMIHASRTLDLAFENSAVFAFGSALFHGDQPANLTIKNSLFLSPALVISRSGGGHTVSIEKSTIACICLAVSSNPDRPVSFRVQSSHLETNHYFLWAPGDADAPLKAAFQWQGDRNSFSPQRGWVSSSSKRRSNRNGFSQEIESFGDWQTYWNSDSRSREVAKSIIRNKPTHSKNYPSTLKMSDFKIPYPTGADTETIGPR